MSSAEQLTTLPPLQDSVREVASIGNGPKPGICRASIAEISDNGEVLVRGLDANWILSCDCLMTGQNIPLSVGDIALVHVSDNIQHRPVLLGIVGRYTPPVPIDHHCVEASQSILLKCGESSLEMRNDGRILLQGKDIVSLARRVQRIKGGSVAIN